MEWKVGDSLHVMRKGDTLFSDGRMNLARVVTEVHSTRLILRRKVYHGERMPTESLSINDVERWWREGYLSVAPRKATTDESTSSS